MAEGVRLLAQGRLGPGGGGAGEARPPSSAGRGCARSTWRPVLPWLATALRSQAEATSPYQAVPAPGPAAAGGRGRPGGAGGWPGSTGTTRPTPCGNGAWWRRSRATTGGPAGSSTGAWPRPRRQGARYELALTRLALARTGHAAERPSAGATAVAEAEAAIRALLPEPAPDADAASPARPGPPPPPCPWPTGSRRSSTWAATSPRPPRPEAVFAAVRQAAATLLRVERVLVLDVDDDVGREPAAASIDGVEPHPRPPGPRLRTAGGALRRGGGRPRRQRGALRPAVGPVRPDLQRGPAGGLPLRHPQPGGRPLRRGRDPAHRVRGRAGRGRPGARGRHRGPLPVAGPELERRHHHRRPRPPDRLPELGRDPGVRPPARGAGPPAAGRRGSTPQDAAAVLAAVTGLVERRPGVLPRRVPPAPPGRVVARRRDRHHQPGRRPERGRRGAQQPGRQRPQAGRAGAAGDARAGAGHAGAPAGAGQGQDRLPVVGLPRAADAAHEHPRLPGDAGRGRRRHPRPRPSSASSTSSTATPSACSSSSRSC